MKNNHSTTRFPGFLKREMEKKMRHLIFGKATDAVSDLKHIPSYDKLYDLLYTGTVHTPKGFGKTDKRVHAKVLDKLEVVGHTVDRGTRVTYELNENGGVVSLEDPEFKMLQDSLAEVEWAGEGTRKGTELDDWVTAAPKELPKVELPQVAVSEPIGASSPQGLITT
jgi:hypothetical protein